MEEFILLNGSISNDLESPLSLTLKRSVPLRRPSLFLNFEQCNRRHQTSSPALPPGESPEYTPYISHAPCGP